MFELPVGMCDSSFCEGSKCRGTRVSWLTCNYLKFERDREGLMESLLGRDWFVLMPPEVTSVAAKTEVQVARLCPEVIDNTSVPALLGGTALWFLGLRPRFRF